MHKVVPETELTKNQNLGIVIIFRLGKLFTLIEKISTLLEVIIKEITKVGWNFLFTRTTDNRYKNFHLNTELRSMPTYITEMQDYPCGKNIFGVFWLCLI